MIGWEALTLVRCSRSSVAKLTESGAAMWPPAEDLFGSDLDSLLPSSSSSTSEWSSFLDPILLASPQDSLFDLNALPAPSLPDDAFALAVDGHTLSDEERWNAVLNRSKASHALAKPRIVSDELTQTATFFYAVTSTKIVCRPGCPSRRPKRENARFFDSLIVAFAAGFASCKRCKPEDLVEPTAARQENGLDAAVAAIRAAKAQGKPAPSLAQLAAVAGFSTFHFHRLFLQRFGLTPKKFGSAL